MNADDLKKAFAPWRAKQKRSAWKPVAAEGASSKSWFGGEPSPLPETAWPACSQCSQPMRFFLQLDVTALPSAFESGLEAGVVQLFYCGTDDGGCETWEPHSGTHDIRVATHTEGGVARPPEVALLEQVVIEKWEEMSDFPWPEEHELLGLRYDYDFENNKVSVTCEDPPISIADLSLDDEVAETIAVAEGGDKLGGWPYWVQGVEYPSCPKCDTQMQLFFQVDSEDNLDYMFGDVGCAHITQCPKHPEQLAFGWACG